MATEKSYVWTPDTPLGHMNDELVEIWTAIAGKAPTSHTHAAADITSGTMADARIAQSNVTQHQAALSITESQISDIGDYRDVHIASQMFSVDSGATNPATWNNTMAGGRLAAWTIPSGSTNIFFWHSFPVPDAWLGSGLRVRTTLWFEMNTAGGAGDKFYATCSGYGYSSGDADTSSTVMWNEATNPDISSYSANTLYSQNVLEGSATIGSEPFIGVRIAFNRGNAGYTYSSGLYFHGVLLELV